MTRRASTNSTHDDYITVIPRLHSCNEVLDRKAKFAAFFHVQFLREDAISSCGSLDEFSHLKAQSMLTDPGD